MTNLGTFGGTLVSFGLNDRGQVIGTSNLAGDGTRTRFLGERHLPTCTRRRPEETITANAINDGKVAGAADEHGGSGRAVIWETGRHQPGNPER